MKKAFLIVLLVTACTWANAQKQTLTDPLGLSAFGFEKMLESRPLITPSTAPAQNARACGTGVYVREETATVNNQARKIKVAIVYFSPGPNTLSTFSEQPEKMKPAPATEPINLPPGFSSLTFFFPSRLRNDQPVLLMRAEKVNDRLIERAMSFPARLDLQEGESPSILWKFDSYIPGNRSPEILGNTITSDPVLLKMTFPRGTKKCLAGK